MKNASYISPSNWRFFCELVDDGLDDVQLLGNRTSHLQCCARRKADLDLVQLIVHHADFSNSLEQKKAKYSNTNKWKVLPDLNATINCRNEFNLQILDILDNLTQLFRFKFLRLSLIVTLLNMDFPSGVALVFSVKRGSISNQCAEVKLSLFFLFVLTEKVALQRSFNFVCACTCFSFTRISLSSESLFGTPRRRADLCLFGLRKARNGDSRSDNSSSEPGEF